MDHLCAGVAGSRRAGRAEQTAAAPLKPGRGSSTEGGTSQGLRGLSSTEIPEGDPASASGAAEENQGLKGKEQCAQENERRARKPTQVEKEPTAQPGASARPCSSRCVQRPGHLNLAGAFHCV